MVISPKQFFFLSNSEMVPGPQYANDATHIRRRQKLHNQIFCHSCNGIFIRRNISNQLAMHLSQKWKKELSTICSQITSHWNRNAHPFGVEYYNFYFVHCRAQDPECPRAANIRLPSGRKSIVFFLWKLCFSSQNKFLIFIWMKFKCADGSWWL